MSVSKNVRAKTKKSGKVARSLDRDQYFSRAVAKALEVLEFLQTEQISASLNEIAKRLNLSKTSTFRLLRTLEATHCLKVLDGGQYQIAPGVHTVMPAQWLSKLLTVAMPHLETLSRELSETVNLAALLDNRIEVIAVIESRHIIRMSNVVGHILPPNASSLGKIITAFQSAERREKLLRSFGTYRFTDHTITDPNELAAEFDRIREQQFADDREESILDGVCLGVPIFGPEGQVSSAISVSMPKSRLRGVEHEQIVRSVSRAAADRIAAALIGRK